MRLAACKRICRERWGYSTHSLNAYGCGGEACPRCVREPLLVLLPALSASSLNSTQSGQEPGESAQAPLRVGRAHLRGSVRARASWLRFPSPHASAVPWNSTLVAPPTQTVSLSTAIDISPDRPSIDPWETA